ncbi:MAG: hypothetical protein LBH47_01085 [Christensenellaceae bacterium]|jgi:hypothetical protein|nr:hypothetical protein [Christensenellaceae bacterium]
MGNLTTHENEERKLTTHEEVLRKTIEDNQELFKKDKDGKVPLPRQDILDDMRNKGLFGSYLVYKVLTSDRAEEDELRKLINNGKENNQDKEEENNQNK